MKEYEIVKGIKHTAKDSHKKKMPKTKASLHKALGVPKGKTPKIVKVK